MIDYYYELPPGTKLFGIERRYVAQYDYHPENASRFERVVHSQAMMHCSRAWMQNANGVQEVNRYQDAVWHKKADSREFALVKLQAVEIV